MSEATLVTRRRRRRSPMRERRIGAAAAAGAAGSQAVGEFPGITMPEPEGGAKRVLSGGVSLLLHAALLLALLLAVYFAPEEIEEVIVEIQRIQEEVQQADEPAPAPRVVAESSGRFDPAPQALAPQIVNPAVVQRAAPVVNTERLQIDTVAPVQAPTEIARHVTNVDQARRYQAVAVATAQPVAVDAQAPAIRGPVEIQAPAGIQAGPRQVASVGNTVGLGAPGALGTGSSVREGLSTGRDVVGAKEGVRAQVNWAVGPGGRGTGGKGLGEGGVSQETCFARPEVVSYLGRLESRVMARWVLPPDVDGNQQVLLRFAVDRAGSATNVKFQTGDPALGESAVRAMRSASPFDPMGPKVRCLANQPIVATFRNPAVASN